MNLILCDDDKVFLNKLEIRIRGLCQKYKIAVEMECYVSAKEMLEGIKNLDEISVFFIDIDMFGIYQVIFNVFLMICAIIILGYMFLFFDRFLLKLSKKHA